MQNKPEGVISRLSDADLLYSVIILVSLGVMAVSTGVLVLLLTGVLY